MAERLQSIRFYGPLVRAEGDAERMVYGVATTETPVEDWPGGPQIVLTFEATRAAAEDWRRWGNIREMHQYDKAVGVAREITAREATRDLFIGAYIADDDAWNKVAAEVYKGFSINADINRYERAVDEDVIRVTDYEIIEVSLVDRPHDPEAVITVFRSNQAGGKRMWDQVWRELMGDRPLPDNAEEVVRAIRALGGAGDGSGEAAAQVQRLNGQVAELSGQVTALLTRVATLEAQPAPLPVLPTPPQQEEPVEQQIERLTRAVQEKRLGAGSPELRQLMRLYQVARRGGGA